MLYEEIRVNKRRNWSSRECSYDTYLMKYEHLSILLLWDFKYYMKSHRECLDTVQDGKISCDIAVNVLNELLTFDKLEAGTLMVEKTPFNGMELIEETVNPFQIQARKSDVSLRIKVIHEEETFVRAVLMDADRNKISQVIRNLVSNGLKFTPSGGSVNVLVNVVDEKSTENDRACKMLKVDVVDSGAGISPENQKRLFKEIVQFNPGKLQKGGGTGLGLYISNGIANIHGGSLSVYSKGEGHGCTFTCTLPCMTETTPRSHSVKSSSVVPIDNEERRSYRGNKNNRSKGKSAENVETNSNTITTTIHTNNDNYDDDTFLGRDFTLQDGDSRLEYIADNNFKQILYNPTPDNNSILELHFLVVDDTAISRKMQCRLLKNRCETCIEAEDGQEAVDKVKMAMTGSGNGINPIDLVIMDCNMPVMNGMDAAKAMRDMGFKGFIIGVTGNINTEDIEAFISHGADVVLPKPLDINKFDVTVKKLFS